MVVSARSRLVESVGPLHTLVGHSYQPCLSICHQRYCSFPVCCQWRQYLPEEADTWSGLPRLLICKYPQHREGAGAEARSPWVGSTRARRTHTSRGARGAGGVWPGRYSCWQWSWSSCKRQLWHSGLQTDCNYPPYPRNIPLFLRESVIWSSREF